MKRFEPVYTSDIEINRIQKAMDESIGFLGSKEILDGKLFKVDIVNGTTYRVGHGLGRKFKGVIPVLIKRKLTGAIQTFDHFIPGDSDDDSIYFDFSILGSHELTVSFWIF